MQRLQRMCGCMYCKLHSLVVLFLISALVLLTGCDNKPAEHLSDTRLMLDTYCTIVIHGDVDSALLDEAFALCAELEALLSITIEGSDIWRINHAGGEAVEVHPRTMEVIKAGLELGELSEGMFDITIGRLTRLWDFGSGEGKIPSDDDIKEALKSVDIGGVRIDGDAVQVIMPRRQGLVDGDIVRDVRPQGDNWYGWIDLGAIAKGYIAEVVATFLSLRGASGVMIDLGGDVTTVGNRADGNPWRIALRKPFGSMDEWIGIVDASDIAVVSSGIYERQFEANGVLYHHILDPFTGMPVETDVVNAVIIAENALIGEGLSTIAVLVGSERAPEYFEQIQGFICAVLVLEDGEILIIGDMRFLTIGEPG